MDEQTDGGANEMMEIEDQLDAEMRAEFRQRLERRLQERLEAKERRLSEAQRLKKNGASRCT